MRLHRWLGGGRKSDGGVIKTGDVAADLQCANAEAFPTVRFGKMPARIPDHSPIDAMFFDVVRQQDLGEIIVVELLSGLLLNVRSRRIHDLPWLGWQLAVAARLQISSLHDLRRRLLDRCAALARHPGHAVGAGSGARVFPL